MVIPLFCCLVRSLLFFLVNSKLKIFDFLDIRTQSRVIAYGSTTNSILNYKILNEERFYADGRLITTIDTTQFYYAIDQNSGLINLKTNDMLNQEILSVVVTVSVQDILLLSQPTINCQIAFRSTVFKNNLVFIGSDYRTIDLCEDVPVNSPILSLAIFDKSFSMNPICFSIINNDYFGLINGNNSSNGTVILTNPIDYEYFAFRNMDSVFNFTSKAYFCSDPSVFVQQTVKVKILNVNEHAPRLEYQLTPIQISINSSKSYMTKQLSVSDYDASPFNQYECNVQNDDFFRVIKNQNNVISIQYFYGSELAIILDKKKTSNYFYRS